MPGRAGLVRLCTEGLVPQGLWRNRDSALAQKQLATARAFLIAGCDFSPSEKPYEYECHWIEITYKGFDYFEIGKLTTEMFYIPSAKRLRDRAGEDWY